MKNAEHLSIFMSTGDIHLSTEIPQTPFFYENRFCCEHMSSIIHSSPYKRTGEKQDGRPILEQERTGDTFLVLFRENIGEFPEKNWTGDNNFLVDGRDRNIARPFIYGGGHQKIVFRLIEAWHICN